MDIVDPTDKTVDALMKLDLPAGVDVKIKVQYSVKLYSREFFLTPSLQKGRGGGN